MARFRKRGGAAEAGTVEHQTTIFERLDAFARRAESADAMRPAVKVLCVVLAMMGLGFLLQASHAATTLDSVEAFHAALRHQAVFRVGAVLALLVGFRVGPRGLRPFLPALVVLSAAMLVACYVPALNDSRNGSRRWVFIPFTNISIQASEVARIVLAVWVADRCMRLEERLGDLRRGVAPILALGLFFFALIGFETDLGGALVFLLVFLSTWFVGGARIAHFTGSLGTLGGVAILLAVSSVEYIRGRIDMWFGAAKNSQVEDSLRALGSGDLWGVGLAQGQYRNMRLPYQDSDYVYSLVGEELGLFGMVLCTGLFLAFVWFSLRLVLSIKDRFAALAAFGLLLSVALQAMIHMQVVTKLAPPKGMTLPFFSHGGTSLIVSALAVGLALGAARQEHPRDAA
ncbi:MAG: FtsW/RodA/SpoVE family cell cycle protein [Planctomycetes bacterium]|nr:FtsW/RodA/SpoVE family cell cycle protein [Planctomycetota bacterium]